MGEQVPFLVPSWSCLRGCEPMPAQRSVAAERSPTSPRYMVHSTFDRMYAVNRQPGFTAQGTSPPTRAYLAYFISSYGYKRDDRQTHMASVRDTLRVEANPSQTRTPMPRDKHAMELNVFTVCGRSWSDTEPWKGGAENGRGRWYLVHCLAVGAT